jgi:hypothetical protein
MQAPLNFPPISLCYHLSRFIFFSHDIHIFEPSFLTAMSTTCDITIYLIQKVVEEKEEEI